ncbi:hypothetical protein [Helicobacter bizzozeronii]|uniref:hypothetical protein n=1 Tax=Helicobacter bizzozeronii TaxID=56877 RepID=UPI000CF16816|nr:hypothetical protein [Helicobacter bizzozeronii]
MKKFVFTLLALCSVGHAELYKVIVTREAQDLYKTLEGFYIKTMLCLELAYSEEAVLKYEGVKYSDKLIFSSGTSCDVDKILK